MPIKSIWSPPRIGSGLFITNALLIALLVLLCSGYWIGWDATWRSLDVTPLQPHFYDMHAVTDHAACSVKGFNAYILNPCDPRTLFNYPPIWLRLGYLGIDGSDSAWLSVTITVIALGVLIIHLKGRSVGDGALASMAILSPSLLMGIERGNIDLFILALVGGAALIAAKHTSYRLLWALALVGLAVVLKLYPLFCVAFAACLNRRSFLFAAALTAMSLGYFTIINDYIPTIRQNTPTTFILSYGYKTIFLGIDHLRKEADLGPTGLVDTWLPATLVALILLSAVGTAFHAFWCGKLLCPLASESSGVAFLFGAGIFCGTFLLGTNFIYRLMFLLLIVPQLQDWAKDKGTTAQIARIFLGAVLSALWLHGSSSGHSTFTLAPQLLDWLLFFGLTTILLLNFLRTAIRRNTISTSSWLSRGANLDALQ
jgi:hypothetical protein